MSVQNSKFFGNLYETMKDEKNNTVHLVRRDSKTSQLCKVKSFGSKHID
jgi:hypothetical protein